MTSVLIVDDSRIVRAIARRMLGELGFASTEAADGRQAIDACTRSMPDLILLDWNMPVMDGVAFLRSLRRMPRGNRPQVVFCTTENTPDRIRDAMAAGANEYIMKPYDKGTLESKLALLGFLSD